MLRVTRLCIGMMVILAVGRVPVGFAEETPTRLKPGEGRELVLGTCTACHSEALVLKNHMTRKRWDETITWMQEKQGLWELSKADRRTILDYLAKHQGVSATGDGRQAGPSLYKHHYPPNPLVLPE